MNQTPIKTFDDYKGFSVFTYENGDQVILNLVGGIGDVGGFFHTLEFYDLSFTLTKTVNFSTIPGFVSVSYVFDEWEKYSFTYFFEKQFSNDNLLKVIVITDNGWAIVNENLQEVFRKSYTDDWKCDGFGFLETKNGNLLVVNPYKQTGITECCEWYEGECMYECETVEQRTEIYALPGYSASGIPSTTIQQVSSPYPNPAKTYIHLPYALPEGVREGTIRVFNSQGQMIKTFRVNGFSEYVRLDTSALPSGSYFFTLDARGQKGESKKFIVNK